MASKTLANGRLIRVALGVAAFWVRANLATSAEAAPDLDPFAKAVPGENPYQPGETIAIHRNLPTDAWPQLANTPQRTGYTPMKFDPPQGKKKWAVCLTDLDIANRINATVQPIVAEGRVYVGCKNGRLFALDAKTGEVKWTFQAGGPICHTAGYAKGRVVVAAMDGCVSAVNAASGKQEWVFSNQSPDRRHHGFSTAVLLAEDKGFAVDRGGRLFALNLSDGRELWHYDADAPVDQSPAYDAGKVFFASEDMRVHAVNAADGTRQWRSEQLPGLSFRWFYPVVVSGKVIVRSLAGTGGLCDNANPAERSLFALDEDTGKQSIVLQQQSMGHDGTQPPPAVTRDGLLVVQIQPPQNKGGRSLTEWWALEDPKTQAMVMPLLETQRRPPNDRSKSPWIAGQWAGNENATVSVIGECVMAMHPIDAYNAGGVCLGGAYELATRRWYVDVRGRQPNKESLGWEPYGCDGNESGGSDAVTAADGLLYHHVKRRHIIICYEPVGAATQEGGSKQ